MESKITQSTTYEENNSNSNIIIKEDKKKDENKNKNKKLIFLVQKEFNSGDTKKPKNDLNIRPYKIHDKNEKDNIITKIQIHYRNFLIDFINEIISKILFEECYITKKLDKIIYLKEYLFNKIDSSFKSNTKKEIMEFTESIKIKELISPSITLCNKFKIKNKNQSIMEKIESLNNPILNMILDKKYLDFFDLYYNSQRKLNFKGGEYNIDIELSHNVKLFDDLIKNAKDDEIYISKLKKFSLLSFYKNNRETEKFN